MLTISLDSYILKFGVKNNKQFYQKLITTLEQKYDAQDILRQLSPAHH